MTLLSNVSPVSARVILSRAATHLQMMDRDALNANDAQHVGAAQSLIEMLLVLQPIPFPPPCDPQTVLK
jgi:hypothetical protein